MTTPIHAKTVDDVRHAVRELASVRVVGGGTKSALSREPSLSVSNLSGVVEYEPSEFTITALAGSPIRELNAILASHGQFLPFDPPFAESGATLGGTIASGLSGSGRFRYGGTRDFLLGVRLVNGEGDVVRGGGRVVKNAAGFDIPKLTVGSLGRFGVLVEATFKVFPRPESYASLVVHYDSLDQAVGDLRRIALAPAEVSCLDLVDANTLLVRLGGMGAARRARIERTSQLVSGRVEVIEDDASMWRAASEFHWLPDDHSLVKIPITTSLIPELEKTWNSLGVGPRRYAVGGHVVWLAWPNHVPWDSLDHALNALGRPALVVRGACDAPLRGPLPGGELARRLSRVFDPRNIFRATDHADAMTPAPTTTTICRA